MRTPVHADLLELDLRLDAAHVAHLILNGPPGAVDAFIEQSRFRERLERYHRQSARRESLPQPPGDTS